jgi:hypothetical protein
MAFPGSPINGQITVVNNISYTYEAASNAWYRTGETSANLITVDTVSISSNATSTSTTTGVLTVAGGAGIAGNVFAGAVYTNSYFYANGSAFAGGTGGVGFTGSAGAGFTGSAGFVGSAGTVGFTGSTGVGYTGSAGGGSFTTGNTAPGSPATGAFWFNTNDDTLYQYMNTGLASYWIDITGSEYNFGVSAVTQGAIASTAASTPSIEYLVVAGGGSGAKGQSSVGTGGGGAGGLLTGTVVPAVGTSYTITIGAGGAEQPTMNMPGNAGSNSSIGALVLTYGGGRGGFWSTNFAGGGAGNGGSGGGRGGSTSFIGYGVYPGSPYIDAPRQGYDGGNGTGTVGGGGTTGGGGGGAGGAGTGSTGGIGLSSSISGSAVTYAAGGAGGAGTAGGLTGAANTGNGGAGGSGVDAGAGKAGGSGVVIIRYPSQYSTATTTGSPSYTNVNNYKTFIFTSSGTITF